MADQRRQDLEELTQPLLSSEEDTHGKNASIFNGLLYILLKSTAHSLV